MTAKTRKQTARPNNYNKMGKYYKSGETAVNKFKRKNKQNHGDI